MDFICDVCDIKFTFYYELIIHRSCHNFINGNETDNAECDVCEENCYNSDHLKNHVNQHVQGPYFNDCKKYIQYSFKKETFLQHKNLYVELVRKNLLRSVVI